jgi:phosphohistidine phosphatase
MQKKLILIRHAKSEHVLGVSDFQRSITHNGVLKTKELSQVKEWFPTSATWWCSTANRTRQTAAVAAELVGKNEQDISYLDDLYTFSASELQACISQAPDEVDHLVVFGHNEAITDTANEWGSVFVNHVPTSGMVALIFEANSWKKITEGTTATTCFPHLV